MRQRLLSSLCRWRKPRDPLRSSSFFFFCLLVTGPREASRRVEPCWIHVLPCVQHGTLPRASVCSSLSSSFLLASEPVSAAPNQRAHVLQHKLPHFWPTTTVQLPKGAIRVTVPPVTPSSGNGDMIVPLPYKTKALLDGCVFILASVCFISLNMFSSHMMKMPVIYGPESPVYCALLATLRLSIGPSPVCDVCLPSSTTVPFMCSHILFVFHCWFF